MTLKKATGKIHLWLGFTSGIIVFIISVTGCLYAFQSEILDLTEPFRHVAEQRGDFLPPSVLKAVAEEALPGKHIHAVAYGDRDKAAQVIFFSFDPEYYYVAFIDPYTSKLLHVKDMEADFFHIVLDGHFYLWLPPEIGQPVAATATLVFVVMLISGIILWWPRKQKDTKQRFTIKWNARWRRLNYDFHNVPGFYASLLALVFALTGLVWGFQWFANGVYKAAGGDKSLVYTDPLSDTTTRYRGSVPAIDEVYYRMKQAYPGINTIEVHIPEHHAAISANANDDPETYWRIDYRYFDQNTLNEVKPDHIYGRFPEARFAEKLIRLNYDIHTGAIFGLPGKTLAFFASFICASLPVTGVIIWWGRRTKKKEKERLKPEKHKRARLRQEVEG